MNPTDPRAPDMLEMPENFHDWNEHLAVSLASEEGISLGDAHWEVLHFMRQQCQTNGPACNARLLLKQLSRHFAHKGGRRYLFALFPQGPVTQASKIAGIPLPPHAEDASLGNVH